MQRFVTTAEQMAEKLVAAVKAPRVSTQEPFHAGDQVGLRRLDDQMKMVGHQTQGVYLPAGFLAGLGQGIQKESPILIIPKYRFTTVAAIEDVVNRSGIFNT